jgi:quercetin dioxygenase-like cupin family protein
MIRAYKLFTGADGQAHVTRGTISTDKIVKAISVFFSETPAHSVADWHTAPSAQYVVNISGVLEFTTRGGESFILKPGDVIVALDRASAGHKWKLIDDQPWRCAQILFEEGSEDYFIPDDDQARS